MTIKNAKPCPFCGGTQLKYCKTYSVDENDYTPTFRVECRRSGCETIGPGATTRPHSVTRWNSRVDAQDSGNDPREQMEKDSITFGNHPVPHPKQMESYPGSTPAEDVVHQAWTPPSLREQMEGMVQLKADLETMTQGVTNRELQINQLTQELELKKAELAGASQAYDRERQANARGAAKVSRKIAELQKTIKELEAAKANKELPLTLNFPPVDGMSYRVGQLNKTTFQVDCIKSPVEPPTKDVTEVIGNGYNYVEEPGVWMVKSPNGAVYIIDVNPGDGKRKAPKGYHYKYVGPFQSF